MKPIVQKEKTGCGIASVAALAGVGYDQAKGAANRLGIFSDDRRLWSETKYVRILLRHFGISVAAGEQAFVAWEQLPDRALLAIKFHLENGKPFWHWVVFVREKKTAYVLDPKKALKKNKRTDFGRMKPQWFIKINA